MLRAEAYIHNPLDTVDWYEDWKQSDCPSSMPANLIPQYVPMELAYIANILAINGREPTSSPWTVCFTTSMRNPHKLPERFCIQIRRPQKTSSAHKAGEGELNLKAYRVRSQTVGKYRAKPPPTEYQSCGAHAVHGYNRTCNASLLRHLSEAAKWYRRAKSQATAKARANASKVSSSHVHEKDRN